MSELHKALETLGYIDWTDVPVDNLKPFLNQAFEHGELICNSVPQPPGGTDFARASPVHTEPNTASTAKEMVNSDARPSLPHESHAGLRSLWGKPYKLNAKDNPLDIQVYKMAGKDRHGAWFARRSVHEGLSFSKFKAAMQREFPESLAVQGGPGEGNVRGIGGDRRLERKKVEGEGQVELFQLSAQFPGPTTPREFMTLLLTSSDALSQHSTPEGRDKVPRHFMVVSKPTSHPDAPERDGYVRGTYESVEMIREIPLDKGDPELNPVEWIMITRSDPGGGIPRFMVERGTPSSITADAVKFLQWATGKDEIPDPDHDEELQNAASAQVAEKSEAAAPPASTTAPPAASTTTTTQQPTASADGGVVSHLTNALSSGIDAYAPASVASYLHGQNTSTTTQDYDSSDSSSTSSFASADEGLPSTTNGHGHGLHPSNAAANPARSTDSLHSRTSSRSSVGSRASAPHDKELQKLHKREEALNEKLARKRAAEAEKLASQHEKESADRGKAAAKHDKEISKAEEKHTKEVEKLRRKQEKEERKAEEKRKKAEDKDVLTKVTRERDGFRDEVDGVRRELERCNFELERLKGENQLLVKKLAEAPGGEAALRSVQDKAGQ